MLITALTTALGFAANAITPIPLIKEFAIASAFAMLANMVVTVLAMPILLSVFGPTKNPLSGEDTAPTGAVGFIVRIIESLSTRHPVIIVIITVALLIAFGMQIPKVEINNDPLSYFQPHHEFVLDADLIHLFVDPATLLGRY